MEQQAQTEQAAPSTDAAQTEKAKKKTNVFIFAVVQDVTTGEHIVVSEKQRKELSKKVAGNSNWKVIASFKGKQLSVEEKKSFNFN